MSAAWWQTAPNPACASFCTTEHPTDDFSQGGGMCCFKTVAETPEFSVQVAQYVGEDGDEPGQISREPASIQFLEKRDGCDFEVMTPQQARDVADALHVALFEAAHVAEQLNA